MMKQDKLYIQAGYTLVEMIVVLALVGVLAAVAIPSFAQQIKQARVTSHANQLQSVFKFARSEAAKRSEKIDLIASNQTWTVKMDNDEVLSVFTPSHDAITITGLTSLVISDTGSASNLTANPQQFTIAGEDNSTDTYYLCVYISGQSKLSKGVACS